MVKYKGKIVSKFPQVINPASLTSTHILSSLRGANGIQRDEDHVLWLHEGGGWGRKAGVGMRKVYLVICWANTSVCLVVFQR